MAYDLTPGALQKALFQASMIFANQPELFAAGQTGMEAAEGLMAQEYRQKVEEEKKRRKKIAKWRKLGTTLLGPLGGAAATELAGGDADWGRALVGTAVGAALPGVGGRVAGKVAQAGVKELQGEDVDWGGVIVDTAGNVVASQGLQMAGKAMGEFLPGEAPGAPLGPPEAPTPPPSEMFAKGAPGAPTGPPSPIRTAEGLERRAGPSRIMPEAIERSATAPAKFSTQAAGLGRETLERARSLAQEAQTPGGIIGSRVGRRLQRRGEETLARRGMSTIGERVTTRGVPIATRIGDILTRPSGFPGGGVEEEPILPEGPIIPGMSPRTLSMVRGQMMEEETALQRRREAQATRQFRGEQLGLQQRGAAIAERQVGVAEARERRMGAPGPATIWRSAGPGLVYPVDAQTNEPQGPVTMLEGMPQGATQEELTRVDTGAATEFYDANWNLVQSVSKTLSPEGQAQAERAAAQVALARTEAEKAKNVADVKTVRQIEAAVRAPLLAEDPDALSTPEGQATYQQSLKFALESAGFPQLGSKRYLPDGGVQEVVMTHTEQPGLPTYMQSTGAEVSERGTTQREALPYRGGREEFAIPTQEVPPQAVAPAAPAAPTPRYRYELADPVKRAAQRVGQAITMLPPRPEAIVDKVTRKAWKTIQEANKLIEERNKAEWEEERRRRALGR